MLTGVSVPLRDRQSRLMACSRSKGLLSLLLVERILISHSPLRGRAGQQDIAYGG